MNRKLAPDIETVLVFASPEYYFVSSRAVKEVAVGKPEKLGDLMQVTGVKAGDKVVLSPPERVKDGASVALAKK